jgi:protein-L-isoaspartate O-methyltransferase
MSGSWRPWGPCPGMPSCPSNCATEPSTTAPLPIGHGQTISQPYIVALMTDLLEPEAGDTILEIGCGSGYQAAVLSRLVKQVHSLEIIPELAAAATGPPGIPGVPQRGSALRRRP